MGDSVLVDNGKEVAKDRIMELARLTWGQHGVLVPKCVRQLSFKLMWCWTVVQRRQAGGVEAVKILVEAVTQCVPEFHVEMDSLDRLWFRFANGHWCRALSRVWPLTPMGWISIPQSGCCKRASSCRCVFA